MSVVIIVVSYRNNSELLSFLNHINSFGERCIDNVVAVANGLDDLALRELDDAASQLLIGRLTILSSGNNYGYFGGASRGLTVIREKVGEIPDIVIVCNDDVRFSADIFAKLSIYAGGSNVGVIAPDIVVPDSGMHQNPFYRTKPSRNRIQLIRVLLYFPKLMIWYRRLRARCKASVGTQAVRNVYAPHGSCIIFRKIYFDKGGDLNAPTFLYTEEFHVAEASNRLNLFVMYDPDYKVYHYEHRTTSKAPPVFIIKSLKDALAYISRNYY